MRELVDQLLSLLSHLKAAWRYRWYAVACAWIVAAGGWSAVYLIPDRYEASARVYVDTQTMLRPLLKDLAVQPNVDQMVAMMSRTLVSRLNVEKVIGMSAMDSGLTTSEEREELIADMIKRIAVRSDAGRENLYVITYRHRNPDQSKRVVESLLTIFMEGPLGDKRRDSDSARRFIDEQLQGYSEKLVTAEKAVTEFKRRHQGFTPNQERGYYVRLNDARTSLRQAELELKEAVNSRDAIKNQLAGEAGLASRLGEKGAGEIYSEIDARIHALEQKRDGLRLIYTEQHPDIVAATRTIAQLKEQRMAQEKLGKPAPVTSLGPVYQQQLAVALASAEANVAAMKTRAAEYRIRYNELQAAANALPQIEAEYAQLTRDYEVIRARYDKLLERRESAQITGDVEASDITMGFRVIDPPQLPRTPSTPNRLQLMSVVLLAALGSGLGIAFLISQLRPTFSDERRLREVSGLRVLGTVAMVWTDEQKKRRTRGLVAIGFSFLSLLLTYVAVMASLMMTVSRV
jgi:polysaccharide chain length determinant protein (PEP-CTERM system associated)